MADIETVSELAQSGIKTAAADRSRARRRAFGWGHVLSALAARMTPALGPSRRTGGAATPLDDFGRLRSAREAMVDAVVAVEDWLEMEHPGRRRERAALRAVRRRLEWELWP